MFNAYLAKQDSCGLIITYSGETGSLNQVAKLLVEQNIPVITITSMGRIRPLVTRMQSFDCVHVKTIF